VLLTFADDIIIKGMKHLPGPDKCSNNQDLQRRWPDTEKAKFS